MTSDDLILISVMVFSFEPIGFYHSDRKYKSQAPRQGTLASGTGIVALNHAVNYEQAVDSLATFDRIWLIYVFHLNKNWKPKVNPPLTGTSSKVGLFASRAPYRPNPIGLSAVRLLSVSGLKLEVGESDLLDGTPILDIKPYLAYADAFADAHGGWTEQQIKPNYILEYSPLFLQQQALLRQAGDLDLFSFLEAQLSHSPTDGRKKRIEEQDLTNRRYRIAFRTWRVDYTIENQTIHIHEIFSGYSDSELNDDSDRYADKALHRFFRSKF